MQIRNLTQRDLQFFGEILPQCPAEDSRYKKTQLVFTASDRVAQYQADSRVVLDYVSGMSALAVFRDNRTDIFYLDRVVSLLPGTRFSVLPMEDRCCVDLLTDGTLQPVAHIPVSQLENTPKGLQFEKIYTFLYQECSHNFYFRGEKHLPYELVYVDRGELHNLVQGQDILLQQQQFMVIDSNHWHTQYSDLPVSFLTISFWASDSGLSAIANKPFPLTPQLKMLFKKMLSQDTQAPYGSDCLEALLKILLIELLQTQPDTHAQHPPAGHWENKIMDTAIQRISQNLQKKLTLEELAAMVHVSVPYLYKLFQDHLGTSPGKYITKMRIEECKVLLRERNLTMGQIAERMGFSSLQHFSRQFRNICGITPTQYVRSLR